VCRARRERRDDCFRVELRFAVTGVVDLTVVRCLSEIYVVVRFPDSDPAGCAKYICPSRVWWNVSVAMVVEAWHRFEPAQVQQFAGMVEAWVGAQ
jgi:hypothetical protein